ncbi:MAG: hypothetical protein KDA58_11100, partial [Planctomycetaceae bacterium]|nr:hypothetical protein [Planctomycetaceae bacterium]
NTYQQLELTARGALSGIQVARRMIDRNLFSHFRENLTLVREQGLLTIVRKTYEPYVARVYDNFASERKSWTESLLDPANLTGMFRWAERMLRGGEQTPPG